jgi:hypothetical protein
LLSFLLSVIFLAFHSYFQPRYKEKIWKKARISKFFNFYIAGFCFPLYTAFS